MPNASRRPNRLTALFEWLLAATVPAVVLFVVPWTSDTLEFAKVVLLLALVITLLILWWSRLLLERTYQTTAGPFTKLIGLFLLVAIVSWAFSAQRYTSLVGVAGFYSHALLHWLLAGTLLWLWTQAGTTARRWGVRLFLVSLGLVNLYALFNVFGVRLLPWVTAQNLAFTPLTTSAGILSLLSVVGGVISFGLSRLETPTWRRLYWALALLAVAQVILFDHFIGWLSLMIGLIVLAIGRARTERRLPVKFVLAVGVVLAIGLLGWMMNVPAVTKKTPPADVVLDSATSRGVTAAALKDEPVFGTGPESFGLAFTSHRTTAFNDTAFWNLRFLKPANELGNLLVSVGSIGTIVWFAFVGSLIYVFGRAWWRGSLDPALMALWTGWVVLMAATLYYPANFVSTIVTFFLSGLLLNHFQQQLGAPVKRLADRRLNWAALGFALVIVLAATGLFFGTRAVIAEQQYQSARSGAQNNESLDSVRAKLERAITMHPYEAKYFFTLAQANLVAAQVELNAQQPDQTKAEGFVQAAVDLLPRAAKAAPRSPDTYEQIAELYNAAQRVTGVSFRSAQLDALNQAAAVEPNNPLHYLRGGQILLDESDGLVQQIEEATGEDKTILTEQRQESLKRAGIFFRHALTLKTVFTPADLGLAMILEREGKQAEAITAVETIVRRVPTDADSILALGALYDQAKRPAEAEAAYKLVVQLLPNSTAGHLALAQLYEGQGKNAQALEEYTIVDKLVPNNPQIQEKLQNLSK